MFNDEIESVRLNAINSLKKLSQHLEIREDQLETMLGVLQVCTLVLFLLGLTLFFSTYMVSIYDVPDVMVEEDPKYPTLHFLRH